MTKQDYEKAQELMERIEKYREQKKQFTRIESAVGWSCGTSGDEEYTIFDESSGEAINLTKGEIDSLIEYDNKQIDESMDKFDEL